jgi:acyl-coenzyme A thioesterase PaaI-like protein
MSDLHPIELFFSSSHPLSAKLEASFEGSRGGLVKIRILSPEIFRSDTQTRSLHSGFATIVLDSIMGGAVMGTLTQVMPIATVGLSIHHLRRPQAGETLTGEAFCTGLYNDLAYVTGELSGEDGAKVAIASGTFMLGTRGTSIREKQVESRI